MLRRRPFLQYGLPGDVWKGGGRLFSIPVWHLAPPPRRKSNDLYYNALPTILAHLLLYILYPWHDNRRKVGNDNASPGRTRGGRAGAIGSR